MPIICVWICCVCGHGYLCLLRHVWKAQQWLGYVSSASASSARLSSGGSAFRANAELAFRNVTCLSPLAGRELRAVEETSLNHTRRRKQTRFSVNETSEAAVNKQQNQNA